MPVPQCVPACVFPYAHQAGPGTGISRRSFRNAAPFGRTSSDCKRIRSRRGSSVRRVGAQRLAGVVEVSQGFGVRAPQGGLPVGQPMLMAELRDDWLGATQVGSWHARKQMVFDLVVQTSEGEVNQPV